MSRMNLLENVTTAGPGPAVPDPGAGSTCQAVGSVAAATGLAVIDIEVSDIDDNWLVYDTITLSLSTTIASAAVVIDGTWAFARANLKSISGTGALVSAAMGAAK